jgi:hydroxylamine reductase
MNCPMFCYQCEQTSLGTGCTDDFGVCGKDQQTANLQDLLVYQLEGMAFFGAAALNQGKALPPRAGRFFVDALFSTLTNVNFDADYFVGMLRQSQPLKDELRELANLPGAKLPAAALYRLPDSRDEILAGAEQVDIRPQAAASPDIQSLKDTLLYGIKGMAAYLYHAEVLGYHSSQVTDYFFTGLALLLDDTLGLNELVAEVMKFGQVNLECMRLLDQANTETFGHPEPTPTLVTRVKGPFIIVSGHDLHDLALLLEQTAGKGVNVYTHGEMLPANAYPKFKQYPHLVGNFGSAWQNQQREFDNLPGVVLFTTNCLMEPRKSYQDGVFTTGVVGYPELAHIPEVNGRKDFSPLIEKALALGGWTEDEPAERILTGFGRNAVLSAAGTVVEAVKTGQIKHFFLVGGCDGAKPGRNYYTDFAMQTPKDTVILTLACGKYRFNKRDFGSVAGLPRLLDIGQCNDAYSAIQIALALSQAFDCDVNDLPLTLVLSWYEQKAVCILLTLLSLGIKNIYLGPTLPAFLTPNVIDFLVKSFDLHPTTTADADLAAILAR